MFTNIKQFLSAVSFFGAVYCEWFPKLAIQSYCFFSVKNYCRIVSWYCDSCGSFFGSPAQSASSSFCLGGCGVPCQGFPASRIALLRADRWSGISAAIGLRLAGRKERRGPNCTPRHFCGLNCRAAVCLCDRRQSFSENCYYLLILDLDWENYRRFRFLFMFN